MTKDSSMNQAAPNILTINGGSSSIKFALFKAGNSLQRIVEGGIERIGMPEATLKVKVLNQADNFTRPVTAPDRTVAAGVLMEWIEKRCKHEPLNAAGYQVKKWIGGLAAALGGLDTLVFAGGIGENAPAVRALICKGLEFLGIEFEEKRNTASESVISAAGSRVTVRVIHTDEELMIANLVCRTLLLVLVRENRNSDQVSK